MPYLRYANTILSISNLQEPHIACVADEWIILEHLRSGLKNMYTLNSTEKRAGNLVQLYIPINHKL